MSQIKELEDEAELAQDRAADLNLAATVRMISPAAAADMMAAAVGDPEGLQQYWDGSHSWKCGKL
jgi:hypothetical protein